MKNIEALASTKLEQCLLWAAETFGSDNPEQYRYQDGLLFFDPPTGSGKTYATIKAAVNILEHTTRKVLILTPRNNVLDEIYQKVDAEIKARAKNNPPEEFWGEPLLVRSNVEGVISALPEVIAADEIPDEVKSLRQWLPFLKTFQFVIRRIDGDETGLRRREIINDHKEELDKVEREFRRALRIHLKKKFKNGQKRREHILGLRKGSKYSWVSDLWPSAWLRHRRLIIMNVDKFISPVDTISNLIDAIHDSIFEDAVIFIDEIDLARQHILNRLVEQAREEPYDVFHIFDRIHSVLTKVDFEDFSQDLATMSKVGLENGYESLKQRFENTKENVVTIYDSLQFKYKVKKGEDISADRNFLFQERRFHSIVDGKAGHLLVVPDSKRRKLLLKSTGPEKADTLSLLVARVEAAINSFISMVFAFSANYVQIQFERGEKDFQLPDAVATVLDFFEFKRGDDARNHLYREVIDTRSRKRHKREGEQAGDLVSGGISLFDAGFKLYDIVDDSQQNIRSEIRTYKSKGSPEQMLCDLAEHALVIAISASARFPSIINNFDQGYLRGRLGDKMRELPSHLRSEIRSHYEAATLGYESVNIIVKAIDCLNAPKVELAAIFKKWGVENAGMVVTERFENPLKIGLAEFEKDSVGFNLRRYVKVAKAADEFFSRKNIRTFLFFTKALPKEDVYYYDTELLKLIIDACRKHYGYNGQEKYLYVIRGGKAFDIHMAQFKAAASAGDKVFGVTSFASAGTGINADYIVPDGLVDSLIKINKFRDTDKKPTKDVDGVFLDFPTYMLPFFSFDTPGISEPEKMDDVLLVMMLSLWHLEAGQISREQFTKFILGVLQHISSGRPGFANPIRKTESFHFAILREIYQSLGRICRSSLKAPEVLILLSENLIESIGYVDEMGRDFVFTREFDAVIDAAKQHELWQTRSSLRLDNYQQKAAEKNIASWREVQRVLATIRKQDAATRRWENMREFVLKYPTFEGLSNRLSQDIYDRYIELPDVSDSYSYDVLDDEKPHVVKIYFDERGRYQASAGQANLGILMRIPGMRAYFQKHGYATEWNPGRFILPPVLYKEIYLGALGEASLNHLMSWQLGVELEPLPKNLTEIFDFQVNIDGKTTFFDAKFWRRDMGIPFDEQIGHIRRKMRRNGIKRAVIVNILDPKPDTLYDKDGHPFDEGKIFIIHALSDLEGNIYKTSFDYLKKIIYHEV